jgi:membrane peptidoglycan carboxypeptidase
VRGAALPAASNRRGYLRRFWLPAVLLLAIAAGGLTGIVVAYELNYSKAADEVASLATYRPSQVTRVYADDGETVIGEFALERRIPLRIDEVPPVLKNAILAVEDARFYDHVGIDPIRIIGAAWKNITADRREGGSTLTQQLAKNLFLSREQTFTRKFNEWIIALQIERYYTKNQIMEMYVNHIFLGARAYGFEAAAQTYFNKHAKDLTLDEAALLAGIPRSTAQYSPTANPKSAKDRRDLVLELMARNSFITEGEANAAQAKPLKIADTAYYRRLRPRTHGSSIRLKRSGNISRRSTRRASRSAASPSTPRSIPPRRRRLTRPSAQGCASTTAAIAAGVRPTPTSPRRIITARTPSHRSNLRVSSCPNGMAAIMRRTLTRAASSHKLMRRATKRLSVSAVTPRP